jgi:hypothetical protein
MSLAPLVHAYAQIARDLARDVAIEERRERRETRRRLRRRRRSAVQDPRVRRPTASDAAPGTTALSRSLR